MSNVQDSNTEEGKRNKKEHITAYRVLYSDADEHIRRARVTHVRMLVMFPGFPHRAGLSVSADRRKPAQIGQGGEGGGTAFCTKCVYSGIFLIIIYAL